MENSSSDEDDRTLCGAIPITVLPILGRSFTLHLDVSFEVTCKYAREHVLECAEEILGAGRRWGSLQERWKNCERPLNPQGSMAQCWLSWGGRHEGVDYVIKEILQRQKTGNKKHALKHTKVRVNALKEELRNLRLQRAKHSSSLSHDLTKIAIQQLEKKKLGQMKNQQLANEVSMLNHQTTILTDQLLSLRQGTHALSEGLSRIKSGVISKQQQLEEEQRQKEVSMREDISKTRKSLEHQKKINDLQEQKMDLAKEELLILKVALEERTRALQDKEQLIDRRTTTHLQSPHHNQDLPSCVKEDKEKENLKQQHAVVTKHSATFNERQRRLSAEEAKAFREASIEDKNLQGDTKEPEELNGLLVVLASSEPRQEQSGILVEHRRSETATPLKSKKMVRFSAEALILSAALEGDLELLKHSFEKVRAFNMTSISGTTCLHNAVQSGNTTMIKYLIHQDCDINAQDCNGWTPLHYAAMHCSPSLLDLLISNGASLFLRNSEDQSALNIAREEVTTKKGNNHQNAVLCVKNMTEVLSKLGRANRCIVYALFAYSASSREELSFLEGEQFVVITRSEDDESWWFAENGCKMCGYVPSSYLGSHPRHQVIL